MNDGLIEVERGSADLLGGLRGSRFQRVAESLPDRPYIDGESINRAVANGRLSLFNLELGVCLFFTDESSFMARSGLGKSGGAVTGW